jgi:phytoene desaturase
VHSAIGGTGRLVDGMVDLIAGQGGELRYGAEVEEILVERGQATGVRLADGTRLQSDIVVSNADSAWTYRHLLPASARRHWTDRRIERSRYSNGLFVWYFGTRRRYDDLAHHTIMLGPRYKGLLDDIFTHKRLADDFSLYLHRPTATDPALAPPGCDTFYALSPVPHLDADVDWSVAAEPYRQAIARRLGETLLPGLENEIATSRIMTPVDFQDRLCSFRGAGFSLEPVLWQSAWFRPHNRSEDVGRLYFVGAGTHPGAGLPGVLSSARILDKVVPEAYAIS